MIQSKKYEATADPQDVFSFRVSIRPSKVSAPIP